MLDQKRLGTLLEKSNENKKGKMIFPSIKTKDEEIHCNHL